MQLDRTTANYLRIAFTIYGQGKNGAYWLNKAATEWQTRHNGQPIPDQVWNDIRATILGEFPALVAEHKKLAEWVNGGPQ